MNGIVLIMTGCVLITVGIGFWLNEHSIYKYDNSVTTEYMTQDVDGNLLIRESGFTVYDKGWKLVKTDEVKDEPNN